MNGTDLMRAQRILNEGGFTCVLCRGETVYTATARGVKPLMDWLEQGLDLRGFSAADKVVGRATAYLYCLLGVEAVFAGVMSQGAMDILRNHGIDATAGKVAAYIINRSGDGRCPMELAVADITDPNDAPAAIQKMMTQLGIH
jgi:hypothetical protein